MSSNFERALAVTLAIEGGYVDHPADPGGATNKGITQATYDAWRRGQGKPGRHVARITDEEVAAVYHDRCWLAGGCDALPWPLALLHFDACVHHGPRNAWRLLQRALGVGDDGIPGPITRQAIDTSHPPSLLVGQLWERLRFFEGICRRRPASRVFLLGWLARVIHLRGVAQGYTPEVP